MKSRYLAGNALTLLKNGPAFFAALEEAMVGARAEIHVETYIFRADTVGRRVAYAMMDAARRGVAVHFMLDGFGSLPLPQGLLDEMRAAGVEILVYRPESRKRARITRARLSRLHRKLAVVDGHVAFVGGINLHDDTDMPEGRPRYDYAVRVEGPLVAAIHAAMRRLWNLLAFLHFARPLRRDHREVRVPPPAGHQRAALLLRDNFRHRRDFERAYLRAIGRARHDILIANVYFLPGARIRRGLVRAAGRGVRVRILVQGLTDHPFVHYASQAFYGPLQNAGVELYAYEWSMLHAKAACVDDAWATVGSSNIDPFSLVLSREANVAVYDRAFAAALRADIEAEIASHARRIDGEHWQRLPLWRRLGIRLAYGVARLGMVTVGYAVEDPPAQKKRR